jgi:Zn finger protein HypA/HybF involved in hydrogenase expression
MSIAVAAENGTLRAGQAARGDFRCTDCGYGVTVRRALPVCPMCRGEDWDAWPTARSSAPPLRLGVR